MSGALERVDSALRGVLGARSAAWAGVVASVVVIAGCLMAWTFSASFPPNLTVYFYPAGSQLYTLVLAVLGLLLFLSAVNNRGVLRWVSGGAAASGARIAALGVVVVVGYTLIAITTQLGGLVNVDIGGWVTLAGAVGMLVAARALPDDRVDVRRPRLPVWGEILVIAVMLALILWAAVIGLDMESSEEFIAFLLFLGMFVFTLQRVGLLDWVNRMTQRNRKVTIVAGFVAALAFPFTQGTNNTYLSVAAIAGLFAATAIGLNIVVGLAGLLDLGYIAFFGIGSYVGALLSGSAFSTIGWTPPFFVTFILGAAIAAIFGVLIGAPTLRLRGDYLAIVTLGFGEIFRITMNNMDGVDGPDLTNGSNGIPAIPPLNLLGWDFGEELTIFGITLGTFANYYLLEIAFIAVVVLIFVRSNNSRIGRAWVAIREDETAAAAMGINTTRFKLLAFGLGALLAGAAGSINAHLSASVTPDSFQFLQSIFLLAAIVLGGLGTVSGALLGSTLLILLPEKLRFFADNRLLIFGLALVLMMRFRPEGILPDKRRAAEFHEDQDEVGAMGAAPGSPVAQMTPADRL